MAEIVSLDKRRAESANDGSTIFATVTRLQAAGEPAYKLEIYLPWRKASYTAVEPGTHDEVAKFLAYWREHTSMRLWTWGKLVYVSPYPDDTNPFEEYTKPHDVLCELNLTRVEELYAATARSEQQEAK